MFVYWLIGAFNNDLETLTLTVGLVRSFESVGSAVSYGLGAASGVAPMTNLIVAFVMFVICIPTTSLVVFEVPKHPVDNEEEMPSLEPVLVTAGKDSLSAGNLP